MYVVCVLTHVCVLCVNTVCVCVCWRIPSLWICHVRVEYQGTRQLCIHILSNPLCRGCLRRGPRGLSTVPSSQCWFPAWVPWLFGTFWHIVGVSKPLWLCWTIYMSQLPQVPTSIAPRAPGTLCFSLGGTLALSSHGPSCSALLLGPALWWYILDELQNALGVSLLLACT